MLCSWVLKVRKEKLIFLWCFCINQHLKLLSLMHSGLVFARCVRKALGNKWHASRVKSWSLMFLCYIWFPDIRITLKKTCPHFFNKRGQAWNLVKMGTTFLRSDSDKWGQCLKWWQSESRDNLLFHHHKWKMGQIFVAFSEYWNFTCKLTFRKEI